jgi:hypothetical protein
LIVLRSHCKTVDIEKILSRADLSFWIFSRLKAQEFAIQKIIRIPHKLLILNTLRKKPTQSRLSEPPAEKSAASPNMRRSRESSSTAAMRFAFLVATALTLALALAHTSSARAAEPVRFIPISVLPYYQAGATALDRPRIRVTAPRDEELQSNDPAVHRGIAALVEIAGGYLTPMTLMVIAIRHYDVGLRDGAVFWFYVAKDRFRTMELVLDMNHPGLRQVRQAVHAFSELAGPVINGYAFCNGAKQRDARQRATAWVLTHQYAGLPLEELPALPGNREENISAAAKKIQEELTKELEYLDKPETQELLAAGRKSSQAEAKYCWSN